MSKVAVRIQRVAFSRYFHGELAGGICRWVADCFGCGGTHRNISYSSSRSLRGLSCVLVANVCAEMGREGSPQTEN